MPHMAPCGSTAQIKTKVPSLPHSPLTHVTLSDNCTCFLSLFALLSHPPRITQTQHGAFLHQSPTMVLIFARSSIAPSKSFSPHMCYTRSTLQHVPATLPRTFLFFPSGARLVRLTKSGPTNIAEPMAALLATTSNFTAPERNTHHTLLDPPRRFQIQVLSSPCLTWRLVALRHKSKPKFQAFRIHISRM